MLPHAKLYFYVSSCEIQRKQNGNTIYSQSRLLYQRKQLSFFSEINNQAERSNQGKCTIASELQALCFSGSLNLIAHCPLILQYMNICWKSFWEWSYSLEGPCRKLYLLCMFLNPMRTGLHLFQPASLNSSWTAPSNQHAGTAFTHQGVWVPNLDGREFCLLKFALNRTSRFPISCWGKQ